MQIAQVKEKYLKLCGDPFAYQHYLNYRANNLSKQVVIDWLLLRMQLDSCPLLNLDGTINTSEQNFCWDYYTLFK